VSSMEIGNSVDAPNVTIFGDVLAANGKGISFSAAGGDTLTMYDEGTFTPAVAGASYASRSGSYTRIGNRVFFDLSLAISALSTSQGVISGLPFTAAAGYAFPARVGIFSNLATTSIAMYAEV